MNKYKKFACFVFLAFLTSDICSYIRYAHDNKSFKMKSFHIYETTMASGNIYNLSIIYLAVVCLVFFALNFFKSEK